ERCGQRRSVGGVGDVAKQVFHFVRMLFRQVALFIRISSDVEKLNEISRCTASLFLLGSLGLGLGQAFAAVVGAVAVFDELPVADANRAIRRSRVVQNFRMRR